MKSWKDHAYLFANGKFKINLNFYKRLMERNPYQIAGIKGDKLLIWVTSTCEFKDIDVSDCTLIARPISDMTAEEFQKDPSGRVWNQVSNTAESFMYLLSIGVLPKQFEKGFEDGTVINTNSIKESHGR